MHSTQKGRCANFEAIHKTIAKFMPNGIPDKQLRAYLSVQFGFSNQKVAEYLETLVELNRIELVDGSWKLVITAV
jgi:hypothetical protein